MSKKKSQHILLPGPEAWELWSGDQRIESFDVTKAFDISGTVPSPFVFAFSVREATALPFVAPTTDEELLEELTEMHFERSGIIPDASAGKLDDLFIIDKGEDSSRILPVVLRVQTEHDMPRRSPANFELSARLYHPAGQVLAVWRELGRWVFACYDQGQLVYFEALPQTELGPAIAAEAQLAQAQLQMQGLLEADQDIQVWDTTVDISAFEQAMGVAVAQMERPAPALPPRLSSLLPADVAAQRREARKKLQILAGAVALVVLLIGATLYLGGDYLDDRKELEQLQAELEELQPDADLAREIIAKSNELEPLIEDEMWPQQLLLTCASCLPPGRKVRFKEFNVTSDSTGKPSAIEISGQTQDEYFKSIGQFNTLLQRNRRLRDAYTFEYTSPQQNSRKLWEFAWILTPKSADPES